MIATHQRRDQLAAVGLINQRLDKPVDRQLEKVGDLGDGLLSGR